jgi:hypothetical protein
MLAAELALLRHLKYLLPLRADASAAQLRRFRPTTLVATAARLRDDARKFRALDLLRRYFPDSFQEFYPGDTGLSGLAWYSLMADLATSLNNSQLFPLDEEVLEDAWRYWMGVAE